MRKGTDGWTEGLKKKREPCVLRAVTESAGGQKPPNARLLPAEGGPLSRDLPGECRPFYGGWIEGGKIK